VCFCFFCFFGLFFGLWLIVWACLSSFLGWCFCGVVLVVFWLFFLFWFICVFHGALSYIFFLGLFYFVLFWFVFFVYFYGLWVWSLFLCLVCLGCFVVFSGLYSHRLCYFEFVFGVLFVFFFFVLLIVWSIVGRRFFFGEFIVCLMWGDYKGLI